MEIQLAVRTPTTAALGSTPIFIQAEVTRGIKIVRVARFDITCVRINGIMKKTAMITYVFVLFPMILIIRSATTSPAPVTLIASDNASTPANRKMVGMWMDSSASFSERTPVRTRSTAPIQAIRYISTPITFSSSIRPILPRMMTMAIFSFKGLNFESAVF